MSGHTKHPSLDGPTTEPKRQHSKTFSMDEARLEENISWEDMLREGPEALKKEETSDRKRRRGSGKFLQKQGSGGSWFAKKDPPAPSSSLIPRDRTNLPDKNVPSSLLIKNPVMEGKMQIRIKGKWKVCFGVLDSSSFYIFKSATDTGEPQKIPLLLCTVKLLSEKGPKCWQLITPNITFKFEAGTDKELLEWTSGIQEICDTVTHESITKNDTQTDSTDKKELHELLKLPANQICADCNAPNPDWASVNMGVFICIQCSGIHRKLGTHISKVQSVTLDTWEPDQIQYMKMVGNARANMVLEYAVPSTFKKPTPTDQASVKEEWIRNKYEQQIFRVNTPAQEEAQSPPQSLEKSQDSQEQLAQGKEPTQTQDRPPSPDHPPPPIEPEDEWRVAEAANGRKYFWNIYTRETSWVLPTLRRNAKKKLNQEFSKFVEEEQQRLKQEEEKIREEEEMLEKEMSELKEKVRRMSTST